MNEIVVKLLELEQEYGAEILLERGRLLAFIKDYFPEQKREQRILEKGLELAIYEKFRNATPKEISFYRTKMLKELVDEHGLNDVAANNTVQVWIRLIELKRGIKIDVSDTFDDENQVEPLQVAVSTAIGKAIHVYKKLIQRDKKTVADAYSKTAQAEKSEWDTESATYEKSKEDESKELQDIYEEEIISPEAYQKRDKIKNNLKTLVYDSEELRRNEPKGGAKDVFDVLARNARNNDATAQNVLGKFYFNGTMTERNAEEAFKWFERAANLGDAEARNNLAYCYFHGEGIEKNTKMAIKWFEKSAKQGNLSAIVSLANCYYDGVGVERNVFEALSWYARAAEKGDVTSQFVIGECYYKGEGVSKSKLEAIKWYEKAAMQNHAHAKERLEELKYLKQMTDARRKNNEAVMSNNTDWYAKRFIARLTKSQLMDAELFNHLEVHSDEKDLLPKILHKVNGLALKFQEKEYPLCIFNCPASGIQTFSNKIVLSTLGIHIIRLMKRPRFIYYADLSTLNYAEESGKMNINDYIVNCHSVSEVALQSLLTLIRSVAKEFK